MLSCFVAFHLPSMFQCLFRLAIYFVCFCYALPPITASDLINNTVIYLVLLSLSLSTYFYYCTLICPFLWSVQYTNISCLWKQYTYYFLHFICLLNLFSPVFLFLPYRTVHLNETEEQVMESCFMYREVRFLWWPKYEFTHFIINSIEISHKPLESSLICYLINSPAYDINIFVGSVIITSLHFSNDVTKFSIISVSPVWKSLMFYFSYCLLLLLKFLCGAVYLSPEQCFKNPKHFLLIRLLYLPLIFEWET
jgi:hypothetical protein